MKFLPLLLLALADCTIPPPDHGTNVGGTGGLVCPGLQCPCPCEEPMSCGPHGACTAPCRTDDDCGRLQGEHCISGLCGVSCEPGGVDDCDAVGMAGSTCLEVKGVTVCGYE